MARWMVTGGAGFIGSHVAEALVKRGEKVRIFDNFFTGKNENIQGIRKQIEVVKGDLREPKDVAKAVKNVDYVLHQAALRSVPWSVKDPVAYNEVNVGGTVNLLWASLKAKVKRVVYASSSSVYGDSTRFPQSEDIYPSPLSPYAVSKVTGEYYCSVFSKTMGLSAVSLRYFNVFGPRQDPKSKYAVVIPIFIQSIMAGKELLVHGDGQQARDFSHIDNVIEANILAATKPGVSGLVFNVACGASHSLLDFIGILEKLSGKKAKVKFGPVREGDVRKTWADISRAKSLLGYNPTVSFEEGVRRTWESFQTKGAR